MPSLKKIGVQVFRHKAIVKHIHFKITEMKFFPLDTIHAEEKLKGFEQTNRLWQLRKFLCEE